MSRSPHISSLSLVVLASAAAAGQAAHADETSATGSGVGALQEVVVTAQKREERLHDVPMGVTAITQSDLANQRLLDFSDLNGRVPGLSIVSGVPGQDQLVIRGQNVGGVGATVATYVDDSPFGSSNALANGSIVAGDFDTWDLARVEVLRGPQGTLYGAGSEGGLFKYVTNAPDPTKFAAAVEAGGEDIAHGQAAGSIKGMVNVPVADKAAFRASGYYVQLPGYISDPNLGEDHVNKGYREGLRASFLWDITNDVSIRLSAFGDNLHTDGSPFVDVVGAQGNSLNPPPNALQLQGGTFEQTRFIREPSDFRYRIYSGVLNWNFGFGTLTSITTYGTSAQDVFLDNTWGQIAPATPFGAIASGLTGVPTGVSTPNDLNIKKWTEELRVASAPGRALDWQVGLFYTHESSTLDQLFTGFLIPSQADAGLPPLYTIFLDSTYKEFAGFGEFTYHFTDQFDLALGGRWSENKQDASEGVGGLLVGPTPQMFGGESTGTDFTYSIAPRFHFSKDTMAYGRIATGYRPGGPNALPPGVTNVPVSYKSDSTKNYEVGTRTSLWDNRLSVDVAAFLINWNDIQLLEVVNGFGVNGNGGTARSQGVEWTFGLTPVTGLSFTLTGAYVDAYLTSNAPGNGGVDGDRLPWVPKWSGTLSGNYTWHAFKDYNMFTGASWSYIGARWTDFSTSDGVTPNPRTELGGYNSVNLQLGLDNTRWTFLLWAKNIADSRGLTAYGDSGTVNLGGSIRWQEPRTVGATVTARF